MMSSDNLPLFGIESIHFVREPRFPTVVLTKTVGRAQAAAVEWESAGPGKRAGKKNLPVGISVEGELLQPLAVGKVICVLRRKRDGVPVRGLFVTSRVVAISGETVVTVNGTYRVVLRGDSRSFVSGGDENQRYLHDPGQ